MHAKVATNVVQETFGNQSAEAVEAPAGVRGGGWSMTEIGGSAAIGRATGRS
jgi:hypothetical protein